MEFNLQLKDLITIGVLIGGLVWSYSRQQREMERLVNSAKESLSDAQDHSSKSLYQRIESESKSVSERFERNSKECRINEKELAEKIVKLEVQMVTEASFDRKMDALKHDIEGNVQKTVQAAVETSQAHMLTEMRKLLETYRQSS